ncbi:hypothetical protein ACWDXD_24900 [Streptomyces sp. NPDC003314]
MSKSVEQPKTATITKLSSELRKGDVVHEYGMRVRLDELHCEPYPGQGGSLVYSWGGTVLNLDEVRTEGHVPASFLREWQGLTLVREDAWTIQGSDHRRWSVEETAPAVPPVPQLPAPRVVAFHQAGGRTITVTAGYTRKSIPTRLRESGAPGQMVNDSTGALRWRLPDGEELTPGEAVKRFLGDA